MKKDPMLPKTGRRPGYLPSVAKKAPPRPSQKPSSSQDSSKKPSRIKKIAIAALGIVALWAAVRHKNVGDVIIPNVEELKIPPRATSKNTEEIVDTEEEGLVREYKNCKDRAVYELALLRLKQFKSTGQPIPEDILKLPGKLRVAHLTEMSQMLYEIKRKGGNSAAYLKRNEERERRLGMPLLVVRGTGAEGNEIMMNWERMKRGEIVVYPPAPDIKSIIASMPNPNDPEIQEILNKYRVIIYRITKEIRERPWLQAAAAARAEMVGVDAQDKDGKTALIRTAARGHWQGVERLIKMGADMNVQDNDGRTAMMHAAMKGYQKVTDMLYDAGADASITDNNGKTAADLWMQKQPAKGGFIKAIEKAVKVVSSYLKKQQKKRQKNEPRSEAIPTYLFPKTPEGLGMIQGSNGKEKDKT